MHLEFLGLKKDPFSKGADAECYFLNRTHQSFLERIEKEENQILVVLGKAGCGKSGLARKLKGIYVDAGNLLPEKVFETVAEKAGFPSFKDMLDHPDRKIKAEKGTIVVDTAEFLDIQALQDVLRLLITRKEKIILFALPGFIKKLKHPDLKSLKERADYLFFPELTKEEGIGYIHYRVWFHKEASEYTRLFDEPAAYYIAKKAKKNPLKMNRIAEESMKIAADEGVRHVTLAHARKAYWKKFRISPEKKDVALMASIAVNIILFLLLIKKMP